MTVTRINSPLLNLQCPATLRGLQAWLVWRYEQHEGEEKARKVPYYAGGGRRAGVQGSEEDRRKLVLFEAALAAAARGNFDGVGFATLSGLGVTALDFDNVVGTDHMDAISAMVGDTYAEFSPSGHGVRAFVLGELGNRKSHAGQGWPFTFETFSTKGFVTFTGMALLPWDTIVGPPDLARPSEGVRQLMAERFAPRGLQASGAAGGHTEEVVGLSDEQMQAILDKLDPDAFYTDWINIAFALHHETRGEGFELFHDWCARGAKYPGRDALTAKWNSFGRSGSRSITGRYLLKLGNGAGVSVGGRVSKPEDFDVVADEGEDSEKPSSHMRFEVVPAGAYSRLPPPEWIIEDLLPEAQLAVFYGPSGAGKSFVLLDLVMAITRGVPWRGLEVKQRRAVYIVAEGGGGFRGRVKAYGMHWGVDLDAVPLGIINAVPNFLLRKDVDDLQKAIAGAEGAGLIVVDTFAKTTAGSDENSGKDMGQALDNCRRLAEETGAMVVLVHHAGKDVSRGSRGWSGIRAAADAEFEVVYIKETGARWLETTKQKDGRDDGRWGFKLHEVVTHTDAKGREKTSAVILPDAVPEGGKESKKAKPQGVWQEAVMEAMAIFDMVDEDVTLPDLVAKAIDLRPAHQGRLKKKQDGVQRAIRELKAKKLISIEGHLVFTAED